MQGFIILAIIGTKGKALQYCTRSEILTKSMEREM